MNKLKITGFVLAGSRIFVIVRRKTGEQIVVRDDGKRVTKREVFAASIAFIDKSRAAINARA